MTVPFSPMPARAFFRWAALAALFFIPFGAKKFLYAFWGRPAELSSAFFYLTDALVALALAGFLMFPGKGKADEHKAEKALFGAFLFFSAYSLLAAGNLPLGAYSLFRLMFAMLFGMMLAFALREKAVPLRDVYIALSASAGVQAVIGALQFLRGRGTGLRLLGEPVFDGGVARVAVGGVEYLRAYGTMAHANILAAFLGIGALALFRWWMARASRAGMKEKVFFGAGFFVLFYGVTVTFSRSGWLALSAALVFALAALLFSKRREFFRIVTPVAVAAAITAVAMQWAILPRAYLSATEPSVALRALYNDIGITMFMEEPFGVGIGNGLSRALEKNMFAAFGIVRPSDFQPIHNIYLIVAVELGAQGIVMLLALLGCAAAVAVMRMKRSAESIVPAAMLVFVLVFGLFDHFFWTLESGRLMFWGVLGIVMGISRPRGITDRTPPSEGGDRGSIPLGGTSL